MLIGLLFVFVLLPLTVVLLLAWVFSKNAAYGRALGGMWLTALALSLLASFLRWCNSPTILDKSDYYGEYIVDRTFFPGPQADWQYNHFRFEITEQDSIFFYVTDQAEVLKTYCGTIRTTTNYASARLIIEMEEPTHHILMSNPTTYRGAWRFYLVFRSPKFYNVFFRRGRWRLVD